MSFTILIISCNILYISIYIQGIYLNTKLISGVNEWVNARIYLHFLYLRIFCTWLSNAFIMQNASLPICYLQNYYYWGKTTPMPKQNPMAWGFRIRIITKNSKVHNRIVYTYNDAIIGFIIIMLVFLYVVN